MTEEGLSDQLQPRSTAARKTRSRERELARAVARLRSLVSGMLDPVVTIDRVGTVLEANESCATVFGYRPDELVGRNVKMLMPEPHRSAHDGYLAHYRATGETGILGKTREFQVVRKDGTSIDVELSVSRIDVEGDEEPFFCGSFREVTQRKRAERALAASERRFRAIFDQEYQFVALLRPDGVVLEMNRSALESVGVERSDVVGRPFWETPWWTQCPDERERVRALVLQAAAGELTRFESVAPDRQGRRRHFDVSVKPIDDDGGAVVQLIAEGRDITPVKEAQERETAFLRVFAEIGQSASILAHEIKNPITALNLALRAVARQLGEDDKRIVGELVERLQRLERLMRRTLSLARPLDLILREARLDVLVARVAEALQEELAAQRIRLESDVAGAPKLVIDADLIETALLNVVRNAVDACGAGGRVRIAAETHEDSVCVHVDDDGPGVPSDLAPGIFRAFVTSKPEGTGLGLALVRKIVEAHGGHVSCGVSPLGGARFSIRLPSVR